MKLEKKHSRSNARAWRDVENQSNVSGTAPLYEGSLGVSASGVSRAVTIPWRGAADLPKKTLLETRYV